MQCLNCSTRFTENRYNFVSKMLYFLPFYQALSDTKENYCLLISLTTIMKTLCNKHGCQKSGKSEEVGEILWSGKTWKVLKFSGKSLRILQWTQSTLSVIYLSIYLAECLEGLKGTVGSREVQSSRHFWLGERLRYHTNKVMVPSN